MHGQPAGPNLLRTAVYQGEVWSSKPWHGRAAALDGIGEVILS